MQPMESISLNVHELLAFLRSHHKHTRAPVNLTHAQRLIEEFEMNDELRNQHLLSVDGAYPSVFSRTERHERSLSLSGFRNMLLSQSFNIIDCAHSDQIYQDMTR